MNKYEIEKAIERGIRNGQNDNSSSFIDRVYFLMGAFALLPTILIGLSNKSWTMFMISAGLVLIGFFLLPYLLAVLTPVLYEIMLFSLTVKDLRENDISYSTFDLIKEFVLETGLLFIGALVIGLLVARSYKG